MTEGMNFEVIDSVELARRWHVPRTWIHNWTRQGYDNDPLPCVKLGRYVRFEWNHPKLVAWWAQRRSAAYGERQNETARRKRAARKETTEFANQS